VKRSVGISITATLILLGSGCLLIIGIYSLVANVLAQDLRFSLITLLLGCWGIATGIGVLLRQRWARLSILASSVAIASWALLAAPTILFYPIATPTDVPEEAIRFAMSVFPSLFALVLAFAFWCIYLLNTSESKVLFGLPARSRAIRPVSTSLIGGFLIVSALLGVGSIVGRGPAMVFGSVYTGLKASTIWVFASAAELYLGVGLLRVSPRSRVLAVFFFLFQLLETLTFLVRPDRESRVADYYNALHSYFQRRSGVQVSLNDVSALLHFWSIEWSILILIALWYLVSRKKAFRAVNA
jgi:hypothetical protein